MKRPSTQLRLDTFDIALLNLVQENNLATSEQLAGKVGLSATACQRRLKRLRAEKVITADVSIIAPEATGAPVTLIVMIALEREQFELLDSFRQRIMSYPEVTQCYYVTGVVDFIMIVRVPSMEAYAEFTERAFFGDKNVRSFQTYAAMRTEKFTTKLKIGD